MLGTATRLSYNLKKNPKRGFMRLKFGQPVLCIFEKIIRPSIRFAKCVIFSYVVKIKARPIEAEI
jgi:hypothetical protein